MSEVVGWSVEGWTAVMADEVVGWSVEGWSAGVGWSVEGGSAGAVTAGLFARRFNDNLFFRFGTFGR